VDEGTGYEMEKGCINFEIHMVDTIDKCGIHNTNDEGFHENIRHGTIHLYSKKRIKKHPSPSTKSISYRMEELREELNRHMKEKYGVSIKYYCYDDDTPTVTLKRR
jgi:hypothetical protein